MSLQRMVLFSWVGAVLVALHLTLSFSAFAQTEARSLAAVMSDMGRTLGSINRPVQQGTAGVKEADLAKQLHAYVVEASEIMPDAVLELPEADRALKSQEYRDLMNELALAVVDLEAAIRGGDMPRAQAQMRLILQLRTKGHDLFRI